MSWLLVMLEYVAFCGTAICLPSESFEEVPFNKLINHFKHATETLSRIEPKLKFKSAQREP
eukprot:8873402-Karenia_brevis.AAC.1